MPRADPVSPSRRVYDVPFLAPKAISARTSPLFSLNEYLKESGVSLVNQYAAVKAQIKELEEEFASIKEAVIAYAKARGISKITGSEFALRITEQTDLRFPEADEEGRETLEKYLKKSGLWEQVSILELKRLKKAIADGAFDDATIRALLEFAEEEEKVSVRLLKRREEEE
ncbi:MAG: hypothetical protein V1771_02910 [Chloroflexota bacterium]